MRSPDDRAQAEQAARQARESWYAEAREHPDATVRLQAIEQWAQQPGESIDVLTQALVDGDEQVRARAQELWEQQLAREVVAGLPRPDDTSAQQVER
ncbi:hypothetical protein [Nitrospira sp. NS4]|uniref:hypothetical protein n=1 Tax=Nitrospira sp. NS4 TaxID=3414498 RepID=UPI003C2C2EF4